MERPCVPIRGKMESRSTLFCMEPGDGFCLGQKALEEKSNEILAIQKIREKADYTNTTEKTRGQVEKGSTTRQRT